MAIDTLVIGAGIIGATVAAAMRTQGTEVLVLDDQRPMSGTAPSGGHLKPSWFGELKKKDYEPAMELLDQIWGLKAEKFAIRAMGISVASTTVYRVDTDVVVAAPYTRASVTTIKDVSGSRPVVITADGVEYRPNRLVIATGAWVRELITGVDVQAKQGVSFRLPGVLKKPFIKPWAPYKQVVAHQQGEAEIWVGDGSAIIPQNWGPSRTGECLERCRSAIGTTAPPLRTITGLRAYTDTKTGPCLFEKLGPVTWVVTGAGKSGTIAAGWAANRLIKEV